MTAVVSKEWKQRMLIIVAVLVGMGGWFLFDGLVAYPNNNVRAAAHGELQAQHGEETPELEEAWKQHTQEKGWLDEVPKKTYTPGQIQTQIVLGFLTWAGAAAALFHFFKSLPLTTRFENGILFLPDGREIALDNIRGMSKRRWQSRSIVDFVYEPEPGVAKRFLLDDYKFIGVAEILEAVEKCLPPDILPNPAKSGPKV